MSYVRPRQFGGVRRGWSAPAELARTYVAGQVFRVEARLDSAHARVAEIRLNAWGVLDALHKFTGVSMDEPAQTRDWALTRIWSLAMDALALVILVLSGLYLWYRRGYRRAETRRPGLVALVAGVACCVLPVWAGRAAGVSQVDAM